MLMALKTGVGNSSEFSVYYSFESATSDDVVLLPAPHATAVRWRDLRAQGLPFCKRNLSSDVKELVSSGGLICFRMPVPICHHHES